MLRKLVLAIGLMAALSNVADAAGGATYKSKAFGFEVTYPKSWHVSVASGSLEKHVLFFSQGRRVYAFDAGWLTQVKAGTSMASTLSKFTAYEKHLKNRLYEKTKWTPMTLGGRPAEFTVLTSVTEGGIVPSQGTVLSFSRGRVYLIAFTWNGKHKLKTLSSFPASYRGILASWHWL